MHFSTLFACLAALAAAEGVAASFLPEPPRETALLANRQATPTSTSSFVHTSLPPDPTQCATENFSQYFNAPTPSGKVFDAIDSFAAERNSACLATAAPSNKVHCTFTDTSSWCAFTTAVPADVLSSYSSTYLSSAVSFWTDKSSTMAVLATRCPKAWRRFDLVASQMVTMAAAHAECYLAAHQVQTQPPTVTPAATATPTAAGAATATASSGAGALCRGGKAVALAGAVLAVLAQAA